MICWCFSISQSQPSFLLKAFSQRPFSDSNRSLWTLKVTCMSEIWNDVMVQQHSLVHFTISTSLCPFICWHPMIPLPILLLHEPCSLYWICAPQNIFHDDFMTWAHFLHYWPFVCKESTSMPSFINFFVVSLNRCLHKQLSDWWFETQ